MKKKLFMICAGLLCTGAMVVGSLNLWAANSMTESQIDNVEALDDNEFDIICGGEASICQVQCTTCGSVFINSESGNKSMIVKGSCPVCGEHIFYLP